MNCKDIADLAPLYLSGEMEQNARDLFRAHLDECRSCALQMEHQVAMDGRLRDAFSSALPDATAIEQTVRKHIAGERSRRWMMVAASAAAVLVASVLGYRTLRPERLFSDAAEDHRLEVVEHQPRRWRTDPAEIGKLAARYGLSNVSVPAGYRLEHAKMCGLDGEPALHLVYTNGVQEFSVFVLKPSGASRKNLHIVSVGNERLAAFQTERLEMIATGGSSDECLQLARAAAGAL
jgi:anti-sigma factor RsiW